MRAFRFVSLVLVSLFSISALSSIALAATPDDDQQQYADEYDENARVVRISLTNGNVSLKHSDSDTWEDAQVNAVLVEGDTITTGSSARVEIQFDARNFVRLDEDTVLRIVTLRDEGVALSIPSGRATLRLARFDQEHEYFEIDAPKSTIAAEKTGLYRIDVERGGNVRLVVRGDGRARVYSETSGFVVRDDRAAELASDGMDAGDWQLSNALSPDGWDLWVKDREQYLSSRLNYASRDRYYDSGVWGAEELDSYGSWIHADDYGWMWRPYPSSISGYSNWSPYRYGRWVWTPPYGWTWVADEPWGWAPYHYGRWVYYGSDWCWIPRSYNNRRSWWRPALVAFVYVPSSYGERICWYPLTHRQRDPRSRNYRLSPLRGDELRNLQRTNPAYLRAVNALPARDFGARNLRAQAADGDIARRAIGGEPVRGRLPVLPMRIAPDDAGPKREGGSRTIVTRNNGDGGAPTRGFSDRPTGATTRTAGVPLNNQLKRERIFLGRPTRNRDAGPGRDLDAPGTVRGNDNGATGIFTRPPRPTRGDGQSPPSSGGATGPDVVPPADTGRPLSRPSKSPGDYTTRPHGGRVTNPDSGPDRPARVERNPAPAPRPRVSPDSDADSPSPRVSPAPRNYEPPPSRVEPRPERRPEPPPRSESRPESRPEPPRYEPRPERRPEPPPRSEPRPEPPPRSEPRPESRPEPRPEPPPRSEPRQEAPRPAPSREPGERPARERPESKRDQRR